MTDVRDIRTPFAMLLITLWRQSKKPIDQTLNIVLY